MPLSFRRFFLDWDAPTPAGVKADGHQIVRSGESQTAPPQFLADGHRRRAASPSWWTIGCFLRSPLPSRQLVLELRRPTNRSNRLDRP